MTAEALPGLHVVRIGHGGHEPMHPAGDPVPAYAASGCFDLLGPPTVVDPDAPASLPTEPVAALGVIGGAIAQAVAAGARTGQPVLVVGGNCTVTPGIVGGLQAAHGADARIGLVWFDAHGDFNTPRTTFTGRLGGMPVAVAAGLAYPAWREAAGMAAPLPTDRILFVDVRNLDQPEAALLRATDAVVTAVTPADDLRRAIADLAARCDRLYLHVDADVLDAALVPNHPTVEPNGPGLDDTLAAMDVVLATGKVAAFALVSVFAGGDGGDRSLESGLELLRGGLESWRRHGWPGAAAGASGRV
ncbi:MAG: arginase family protein [Thermomicrobiales bacterium]|nr:arginase family protein [Thermomicrobiales bacterium]